MYPYYERHPVSLRGYKIAKMKISRDITLIIHFFLDELLPPILRDSKWFMWLPFKLLFGSKAKIFFEFKEKAPYLSEQEFRELYLESAAVHIQRETDLNHACIKAIDAQIVGKSVLDIACGRGFLVKHLTELDYQVSGADIVIDPQLINDHPQIPFRETQLENLPFADNEFDTVICTHTLEHVQNIQKAVQELRRVAARRLIIVVPKQRSYKYTFDLHLHFFPYSSSLLTVLGAPSGNHVCHELDGDWFYFEDMSCSSSYS